MRQRQQENFYRHSKTLISFFFFIYFYSRKDVDETLHKEEESYENLNKKNVFKTFILLLHGFCVSKKLI